MREFKLLSYCYLFSAANYLTPHKTSAFYLNINVCESIQNIQYFQINNVWQHEILVNYTR